MIFSTTGRRTLSEYCNVDVLEAIVPSLSIPFLRLDNQADLIEQGAQISTVRTDSGLETSDPTLAANENSSNWGVSAIGAFADREQVLRAKEAK